MPSLLIHQEDINIPTRPVIRFRIVKRTAILKARRSSSEYINQTILLNYIRIFQYLSMQQIQEHEPGINRRNYFKCLEDKLDVIPEAGILYILQIEFNLLLHDYMDVIIYRNHRLGFRSDSLLQSLVIQPLIIASLTSLH